MVRRLKLQEVLEKVLNNKNVYFQPPEAKKMNYPCIRYDLSDIDLTYANNQIYTKKKRYTLILIDRDPDSEFVDKLSDLPMCRFDRFYTADNLNHWSFELYY